MRLIIDRDVPVEMRDGTVLRADISVVDTDFTATLVDVHPNGFAQNLTDGIIRTRYRTSTAQAELIEPGQVYAYTIDLWATGNVFKGGALYSSGNCQQQFSPF